MEISLLFRKRSPLTDDGLPWLSGNERHTWCARRNTTGEAGVSAILVRALQTAAMQHAIRAVLFYAKDGRPITIVSSTSKSTGKTIESYLLTADVAHDQPWAAFLPNGGPDKVTYYLGLLALAEAMAAPVDAVDLLNAYEALIEATKGGAIIEDHKEVLCRAADELYYWLRYTGLAVDPANDRLARLSVNDLMAFGAAGTIKGVAPFDVNVFFDAATLHAYRGGASVPLPPIRSPKRRTPAALPVSAPAIDTGGFIGRQLKLLRFGVQRSKTILLAGPTGTGKTMLVEEVAQSMPEARLVRLEGKEGMLDVDFLGNVVPREHLRIWQDGPLAEAIQAARMDPVILFLDELTRFPREQINLLIGFLNQKSGAICRQEELDVIGDGPFYVARVPQDNSKVFWCPCAHLTIIAAANFGKDYAVYPLDPALRRRFTMTIEFDYPSKDVEIELAARYTGLDRKIAEALVAIAGESRRVHENGDLPGMIDTASLIEWARKCVEAEAHTQSEVMDMAALTWADLVCGRTHDGRVESGHFNALRDHLEALALLPK
jgi:nitric oxide reductase NorQ protein